MTTICDICLDKYTDEDSYQLPCNHTYHYDCIVSSFSYIKSGRTCPYCRTVCGLLPILGECTPVIGVHIHNKLCCTEKNKNNFLCNKPLIKLTNKCLFHLTNERCCALYKTGKNKGKQCTAFVKKTDTTNYCGRHNKQKCKKTAIDDNSGQIQAL